MSIPLCFYPTTVLMVDDSKSFLTHFSLQLDPLLAYRLYSSPALALQLLLSQKAMVFEEQCRVDYDDMSGCPSTTRTLQFDVGQLYRKSYNPKRFDEVSVVVVDYAMPEMDGLEFCRRLAGQPVKKILLTGQADLKIAVDAFNEGVIDHFVLKNDLQGTGQLNHVIRELQEQYFLEKSNFLTGALAAHAPTCLTDLRFESYFKALCEQEDIVEYYLTGIHGGFLLLNAKGEAQWLLCRTDEELELYLALAHDTGASEADLEKMRAKTHVPYFWAPERFYEIDPLEWHSFLYQAELLRGSNTGYYTALVPDPLISNLDTLCITSYQRHLERLDSALSMCSELAS